MPAAPDDRALASRAAHGDRHAFTVLVRRHQTRVRSFLARTAGAQAADDLAQETFLRAWRRAGSFRADGSYAGWILAIAWRVYLDASKRSRDEIDGLREAPPPLDRLFADPAVKVDVDRMMSALDPAERASVTLCLGQGWSHREAAEILGVPLGTLKTRVARATAKCRAILETT